MIIYDVEKIAKTLGVTEVTIRRKLASGDIKGFKVGKGWRVTEDELKRYIERETEKENVR